MTRDSELHQMLLRPREAAAMLAISERTLWQLTHRGDLPSVRLGRSMRYDPKDLLAWIESKKSSTVRVESTTDQRKLN